MFVHLHVHSNYTLCRGANTFEQLCVAAKQHKMPALAVTDTNGFYGLVWFIQTAKSFGITPLIGAHLELDDFSAVLLAIDLAGYRSICSLISYRHRNGQEGLLERLLACDFNHVVLLSNHTELLARMKANGLQDNIYGELIPHKNREEVLSFCRKNDLPVVATNCVYFVEKEDWQVHKLLRAIDLNTTLERIPPQELVSQQAHFASPEEMRNSFPDCPDAIENTLKIARECTFDLDFKEFVFTSYKGPNGESAFEVLRQRVLDGVAWRYKTITSEIMRRMDYELSIIEEKGFAPYFLVAQDVVSKAPRTCGRGSAAASLVSYCLGITHVDPIRYDLFFERFLNRGRKDPPDIDVDFPWDERDDILDYIFQKYGESSTAMISNHNTFKARSAVREIAKVYGLPDDEIGAITKKMTGYWQPDNIWALTQTHPIYKETEFPPPWPEIIELAEKIRGFPRHLSVHCGGVIIAPQGTDAYVPTQPAKKILNIKGVVQQDSGLPRKALAQSAVNVVQWEKDQSEDMGLIKMDILGNRSLAVIRDGLAAVERNYGIKIDYARWNPLEDPDTIDLIRRGDTIGVFYVESPAMRQLQIKTGKGDFEHLVIHSSIIRPAANRFINEYIRRLKGGSYKPLHPLLEEKLRETYGIMVYQEDVSKVVMALANFTPAEADDLRKIISKKHKQKQILDYRNKFFAGTQRNDVSPHTAQQIWDMIMSFSGYSFCKPHSASYAMVSFKSAYLKAHYPAEFLAAVISNQGGYYSTFAYISEARRLGLKILPPDINESQNEYTGCNDWIRVGFMQIRELSAKTIDRILAERKNGRFTSFDDFVTRVKAAPSDISKLVKAGCFDALESFASRPALLWRLQWHVAEQKAAPVNTTISLFDSPSQLQPTNIPKPDHYDEQTLLQHEVENLGFLISRHPLTLYEAKIHNIPHVKGADLARYAGKRIRMIGWFITGKTVSTKHDQLMEFISFEDTTAIYETTFFPKAYSKFVHMLSRMRPFILEGVAQSHYGACTLNVEYVKYL